MRSTLLAAFMALTIGVRMAAVAGDACAAEWSIEPSVSARGEYDDNIRLTAAPHPTVWGLIVSPAVNFNAETENAKLTGGLAVNVNRYFGEEGLDTTDHYLTLQGSYRRERDLVGATVQSIGDSTLVSELLETGVVEARRQRRRLTANPTWTHALDETTALTAAFAFSNVDYRDTRGTNLIDYTDQTATLGMNRRIGERGLATVTAYYDRYQTRPDDYTAGTYGVQGQYDYDFSETFRGTLGAGVRRTRSSVSSQALVCQGPILFGFCFGTIEVAVFVRDESITGYTALAAVDRRWQADRLVANLSRQVNPTGIGALVQTDRAGATWTHQWSPTVTSTLEAAAYRSRYLGSHVAASDSDFYRLKSSVTWRLSEWWSVMGGYSFSRVTYQSNPAKAMGNLAYVTVAYTWPKLSVSR